MGDEDCSAAVSPSMPKFRRWQIGAVVQAESRPDVTGTVSIASLISAAAPTPRFSCTRRRTTSAPGGIEDLQNAIEHGGFARALGKFAPGEALQALEIVARQPQADRRRAQRVVRNALRGLARRQEMIEQALAVGETPAELLQFLRRRRQQRQRELHDVVERQVDAQTSVSPVSPRTHPAQAHGTRSASRCRIARLTSGSNVGCRAISNGWRNRGAIGDMAYPPFVSLLVSKWPKPCRKSWCGAAGRQEVGTRPNGDLCQSRLGTGCALRRGGSNRIRDGVMDAAAPSPCRSPFGRPRP